MGETKKEEKDKEEVKETDETKEKKENSKEKVKKKVNIIYIIPIVIILVVLVVVLLMVTNKEGAIRSKVKSTLDDFVEKSDLETVNFTYNVIAKKCKDNKKCDKKSNDINDFEYVVSCKTNISGSIDFKNVKVEVDKNNKKVIITTPEVMLKDPVIVSFKYLNGKDVDADEYPNARKLCVETAKERSKNDDKIITAAKDQAIVVLDQFYSQWMKTYYPSYSVEVK